MEKEEEEEKEEEIERGSSGWSEDAPLPGSCRARRKSARRTRTSRR